jgi:hypothetical protein
MHESAHKPLRAVFAYIANFVAAIFGTAVLATPAWRLLGKPATHNGIVIRGLFLSVVIAFCLALFVSIKWPTRAAMWVWVLPAVLLLLRATLFAVFSVPGSVLSESHSISAFLGLDMSSGYSELAFTNYVLFVIPTVRTVAYSAGALVVWKLARQKVSVSAA